MRKAIAFAELAKLHSSRTALYQLLKRDGAPDEQVKLLASAEAEPDALYDAPEGREVFEFRRTVSRLVEMRSEGYLALPHGHGRPSADTGGIVET